MEYEGQETEKPIGIWDGAPEWATGAYVTWQGNGECKTSIPYFRVSQRSKATASRIAQKVAEKQTEYGIDRWSDQKKWLQGCIESAILEALNEKK